MSSIFSKIVSSEIPAFKVLEDKNHLAFLDIAPLAYGHVLVIPKKEIDYLFDMNSNEYLELFKFSKKVAQGMKKVIVCKRIGVAVVGLEVPHAHIHLIPLNNVSDINFEKSKLNFTNEKMTEIAKKISAAI